MARRIPTVLTDEELAAIYQQINEASATGKRNRALLQMMADAGLRVSEAVNLRTLDLQQENGRINAITVRRGKGAKDRTVFTTPQLSDKLLRWMDTREALGIGRGYVFTTIKHGEGRQLTIRYVQQLVKRLTEKAGIEKQVTPHILRHTAATRKLRSTGNLRIVQEDLGHARLETTRIYTHVEDPERQAAAENLPPVDGEEEAQGKDQSLGEADEVQRIAQALAALPKEQRKALAEVLSA